MSKPTTTPTQQDRAEYLQQLLDAAFRTLNNEKISAAEARAAVIGLLSIDTTEPLPQWLTTTEPE